MVSKKQKIQNQQLQALRDQFQALLIPCLEQCSRGRWGLFGAYDRIVLENPDLATRLIWPEANRLCELASAIQALLASSGERDELCEEFLRLRAMHKSNDPGEPKLAIAFLGKIRNLQQPGEGA